MIHFITFHGGDFPNFLELILGESLTLENGALLYRVQDDVVVRPKTKKIET